MIPDAEESWAAMIYRPIGQAITAAVEGDLVRGVIVTDALIGTFARPDDESLHQNVCFLYHLIGGGTGDWDVPGRRDGSGDRSAGRGRGRDRRRDRHRGRGFRGSTRMARCAIGSGASSPECGSNTCLANVTPSVFAALLGDPKAAAAPGSQVKVNLLLRRLPRLRDGTVTPEQASAAPSTSTRIQSARRRIYARGRRRHSRPAAVRNLLPLAGGSMHPVRCAPGRPAPRR